METAGDCDDADPAVNPDAEEVCDEIDNNCNALVDDEDPCEGPNEYYQTTMEMGTEHRVCRDVLYQPEDYVSTAGNCDDTDPAVNPDAEEVCDEIDNNCDGAIDDADLAINMRLRMTGTRSGYGRVW